jgi:hypothetical protein
LRGKGSEEDMSLDVGLSLVENKCIYCLTTTGEFKSKEHIILESLGNTKFILPKGYVCDRCNNDNLSQLDKELIDFAFVAFQRVRFIAHTKQGKPPRANFQNMSIERVPNFGVLIKAKDKTGTMRKIKDLEGSSSLYEIRVRGKIMLVHVSQPRGPGDHARRLTPGPPHALLFPRRGTRGIRRDGRGRRERP